MRPYALPLSLFLLLLSACGSEEPLVSSGGMDGGVPGDASSAPLLPWKTGNRWTYQVTDETGEESIKVTTVGALEAVGGVGPNAAMMANKVVTKKGATDETVSWQADLGTRVVRLREQAFHATTGLLEQEEYWSPHKLHVDLLAAHAIQGASWLEIYSETKLPVGGQPITSEPHDRWTVLAVDDPVTVPAGSFRAVVLQKSGGSQSAKKYWYVRGVGKVMEVGGKTEKLVSYEVVP